MIIFAIKFMKSFKSLQFKIFFFIITFVRLIRVNHITTLKFQEKPIILAEKHLLHYTVFFDNLKYIYNVKVSTQLLFTFI